MIIKEKKELPEQYRLGVPAVVKHHAHIIHIDGGDRESAQAMSEGGK